jgi:hypothetical protein
MKIILQSLFICTMLISCTACIPVQKTVNGKTTGNLVEVDDQQTPESQNDGKDTLGMQKTQLSFAAFTDTHIGARYQNPLYKTADSLDHLGEDLVDSTNLLDFAVHLGDIVHHNTGQVNGVGLPWYADQYKNNLKAYFISHINIPLFCVIGNHDMDDYQMNSGDPHNLTKSLIDELSLNNPMYGMMHDGILFLIVPELGYITWTHPVEYEWVEYMTGQYPNTTTIILCHQAIEDTTQNKENRNMPYSGKQDMDWWASLFQKNPQIKMWIHGHNHYLDWYVSNHSTGQSYPIQQFGHEMAFSAPYPQMDWGVCDKQNKIVIYNITATNITTSTWEDDGTGGHWSSEYDHSWSIPTTFNTNVNDWYSFPTFLQDNETQLTDMKLLSPNITLQLVGTEPMELFFDSRMESPSGWAGEKILGFGNDRSDNVIWTRPGMKIHGPTMLTFPEKYPYNNSVQEDGRSGWPYHSFPMGTISAAVPGQSYNFTMTARCLSGSGRFHMNVSCSDWGTKSQYSKLTGSESQVFSHTFGSDNETIYGLYTVPDDKNAWFLQGNLDFLDSTDYDVSLFSVKRQQTSEVTKNFHLCLSTHWFNISGPLTENNIVNFSVNPQNICTPDGVMNFTAFIEGNHYGMVNLVYHEPLLLGMNARFRINSVEDDVYNLSLTKTISRNSAIDMMIWNSKVFQKFPRITELLVRFLTKGITGRILYVLLSKIFPEIVTPFVFYPFSTNPTYEQVNISADDGSEMKHLSLNGNLWFSCDCPTIGERDITVTLPKG